LKFFQLEGRFPAYPKEVPRVAVEFLAETPNAPKLGWTRLGNEDDLWAVNAV
jgi:hypothetical protein